MVLLPEERGMTLLELRQMAACQQHQIEVQEKLLVTKEQRLKFLKQQEMCHHNLSEQHLKTNCVITLQDKVKAQELKLKQLRAMCGQVEQQKTNNSNLGAELDSIRALFCEKEKELNLAVGKVEELTHQLDEIRLNSRKSSFVSSTSELEDLRRELIYHTKLSEQQNNYICQQREKISNRQRDIVILDAKINDLNERLHRKRLLNEQIATQIHLSYTANHSIANNDNVLSKSEQEILDPDHTQDDLAANLYGNKREFGEFSLTKKDPKYQTLPYNTKFTVKEKQLEDLLSTEEESRSEKSNNQRNLFSNVENFNSCKSEVPKFSLRNNKDDILSTIQSTEENANDSSRTENINGNHKKTKASIESVKNSEQTTHIKVSNKDAPASNSQGRSVPRASQKPAVPPKPALSVKPMFVNRERNHYNALAKKNSQEQDNVTMALSFLKNKSSEEEKSDFRYPVARESSQDPLLPKSRILTYFSKTLLQPDGGLQQEPNEKIHTAENPKRKSAFGQLPIKPKPLMIRKNPGIEPPKLKVQSFASSCRKVADFSSKAPKTFSTAEDDEKPTDFADNLPDASLEKWPSDVDIEAAQKKSKPKVVVNVSDSSQVSENAAVKIGLEPTRDEPDYSLDQSDDDNVGQLCSALHKIKKGNLKSEGSVLRASRRVSFDPLALLLDAALEGELELVKKIASEVVNPSAANDEGITALHNAICAGQFEVVKFLVEFGCDVNAPDSDGWTPLHCAASCNNLMMVKFLVERGACIFATTLSDQETAAEKCEEDGAGFDGCSEYLFSLQDNLGVMNDGVVYAVYKYDVQNADELSFRNGDMLTVLRRSDDEENEWWWCRLNDQEGYVPRNLLGLYPRVTCPNVEESTLATSP